MTLPLIIVGDLLDAAMVVVGVPRQEARVLLVGHQQAEPHHQVDHDEDVVCVGQQVPRDWDALGRKRRFKTEKIWGIKPTLRKYMGYAQRRTLPRKKRRGPRVRPLCPKTKVLNRIDENKSL